MPFSLFIFTILHLLMPCVLLTICKDFLLEMSDTLGKLIKYIISSFISKPYFEEVLSLLLLLLLLLLKQNLISQPSLVIPSIFPCPHIINIK